MSDFENKLRRTSILDIIRSNLLSGKSRFLRRKDIDIPEFFKRINLPTWSSYDLFPDISEMVDITAWRSELHSVCITIVLDRLINALSTDGGRLYLFLWEKRYLVENYVNLGTIEIISSGIKYDGSFVINDMDVMMLSVDSAATKSEIEVPSQPLAGFEWKKQAPDLSFSKVSVSKFGGEYVLNFGVCGEFNLSIFFQPNGKETLQYLFSHSFCCK